MADAPKPEPETDEAEDCGCFGWLRGVRERSIMLELRKKDGHILAVGYSWLERVEFDPSEGITLHLPGRKIKITGSGLNSDARPTVRLFDGIIRHRVPWIREADRSEGLKTGEQAALVEGIQWDE
ncbi:hypothetical protein [Synechococcus sp. RedBA-s]|uniref:hypothetical protein n=1 Tax=Synechococcus sp. RedBA-s TaxID=2823741 RepID=UPI0020CDF071|nr:hypothetical protein [Synechococcus sp. RedBA-s]